MSDSRETAGTGIQSTSQFLDPTWERRCRILWEHRRPTIGGKQWEILTIFADGQVEMTKGEYPSALDAQKWRDYMLSDDHRSPIPSGPKHRDYTRSPGAPATALYVRESTTKEDFVQSLNKVLLGVESSTEPWKRVSTVRFLGHQYRMQEIKQARQEAAAQEASSRQGSEFGRLSPWQVPGGFSEEDLSSQSSGQLNIHPLVGYEGASPYSTDHLPRAPDAVMEEEQGTSEPLREPWSDADKERAVLELLRGICVESSRQ